MATISSPGIGSGLDIQSIVTQLVALEKAPLTKLKSEATSYQTTLSTWSTIKSQVSALGDAADKLSKVSGWNPVTASSSNSTAIGVVASAGAVQTSISMSVQRLAQAQSSVSSAVPADTSMGTGSLTIDIGTWSGNSFSAGSTPAVTIDIEAGKDKLGDIAAKINDSGADVSATILRDASGERLMLRSKSTGEAFGFRVSATDDDGNDTDASGLSRLAYAAGNSNGQTLAQAGLNALATINNIPISSTSNKLTNTIDGLTLQLNQVTTAPVEISVERDDSTIKASIQAFVDAYNTLNNNLVSVTRYDASTKAAGALQGDATATGLTNALRSMMRSVTSSTPFSRLSEIGLELKSAGKLEINSTKLSTAISDNFEGVKDLFMTAGGGATSQGFGLKVSAFADGLMASDGLVSNRTAAIQSAIKRNGIEQEKVTDRASRVETRLLAQYNAMDSAVAKLNSLNTFVSQQISLWNKS